MLWSMELDRFIEEFRKCINKKNEEKISLVRYMIHDMEDDPYGCVYRTQMHVKEPSVKAMKIINNIINIKSYTAFPSYISIKYILIIKYELVQKRSHNKAFE